VKTSGIANMLHTVVPARASPAPRPAPRRLPVVAVEFTYLKYLNIYKIYLQAWAR
jgi:hypothetical protein